MQRSELILDFPPILSCIILTDWLNLKSVKSLDSAYCCRSRRKDFVDLLQSDEYFIRETLTVSVDRDLESMVVSFGEKMRSVEISSATPEQGRLLEEHCHNLTHLKFSEEEACTSELWDLLKTNPHIESLTISRSDEECLPFPCSFEGIELSKLTALAVKGYQLEDENILDALKNRNVFRLDLSQCEIEASLLFQIARACPRLRTLVLSDFFSDTVTDEVLTKLTTICPQISHLNITYARAVTDTGMLNVAKNLKKLRSLNIADVSELTDACLVHIYTHCASTLHALVLNRDGQRQPRFSTEAINALLERCTQLRTLHLYDCRNRLFRSYTNNAPLFTFSAPAIRNLTTLVLDGEVVTDENLAIIGTHGVHLQVLVVESDYKHTQEVLAHVVNGCSHLKQLQYNLRHEHGANIPEVLSPAYWMKHKPGLLATLSYDGAGYRDLQNYDFRDD